MIGNDLAVIETQPQNGAEISRTSQIQTFLPQNLQIFRSRFTLEGFKVLKTWVGTVAEHEGRDDHPMPINGDCTGYISMVGKMCWASQHTLWLFNIAMENGPCIDDVPIKTSIYKGFSMAMFEGLRQGTFSFVVLLRSSVCLKDPR